jgi:hypothetical protein
MSGAGLRPSRRGHLHSAVSRAPVRSTSGASAPPERSGYDRAGTNRCFSIIATRSPGGFGPSATCGKGQSGPDAAARPTQERNAVWPCACFTRKQHARGFGARVEVAARRPACGRRRRLVGLLLASGSGTAQKHYSREPNHRGRQMAGTIDTYFEAWNATDDAERCILIERCLTNDVELIDENGRFSGHDGLGALMAKFHQAVPGGRIVKTSDFDEFEGITRYSWDVVDADGNTKSGGLDVVEQGADGRLRRIVMFHGPLPALG